MPAPENETHHRRSIRLADYDYTQDGAYFITICTHRRTLLFGDVIDDAVSINTLGCVVFTEWERTAIIRSEIRLDEFIVMPNHFHAIIWIIDDNRRGAPPCAPTKSPQLRRQPRSLGSIVAGYKSAVTRQINQIRQTPGEPVWQRNYYEHVIRNETSLNEIRRYIRANPAGWAEDENHPAKI